MFGTRGHDQTRILAKTKQVLFGVVFAILLLTTTTTTISNVSAASSSNESKTRENTYQLQQALEHERWEDCGVLKTRVTEKQKHRSDTKMVKFHGIKVAYKTLMDATKQLIEKNAKDSNGGYYRLRISTLPKEEEDKNKSKHMKQNYVLTSVRTACLVAANFRDHFNLHFDDDGITLVNADHTAVGVDCPSVKAFSSSSSSSEELTMPAIADKFGPTTSSIKFSKVAPALSVVVERTSSSHTYDDDDIEGGEGDASRIGYEDDDDDDEAGGRKGGKPPPDERTWMQKNWMLLLAGGMMIVNLLGSSMEPQRQQQRRNGGGGAAAGGGSQQR